MTTSSSASTRQDVHAPSNFDPADYRVIDYLDVKKPEAPKPPFLGPMDVILDQYERIVARWQERIFEHFPDWKTGGSDHKSIHQCNHCGQQGIRWVAVVEHIPTGARLAFGETCAERVEIEGRDKFRAKFIKDRAAREQAAYEKALAEAAFVNENADVVAYLTAYQVEQRDGSRQFDEFLSSLYAQLERKGELSEAQVAAVRRNIERQQQFEQRKADEAKALENVEPLVEGRRSIEGVIVSAKVKDTPYGLVTKMLVREADGNKVYGTMPASVEAELGSDGIESAGRNETRVKFTAKVERSQDDEHFGFFSRPTNAEVVAA